MTLTRAAKLRPHLIPLFLIVVATFAVYGRLLWHDFQNLDDPTYVTLNPAITGFTWQHIKDVFTIFYVGNYAPVQMLSYMLDYTLWGMWAGGFLFTNIAIHSANGFMAYRLFLRFQKDRIVAFVGAGIFLLHPVQVESVAWISERKNLLAMLFFLLAWECYCSYRESVSRKKISGFYALSLVLFVLALLAKPIAVILPVALVMYDFFSQEQRWRVTVYDKLPFVLAAGACIIVAMYSQQPDVVGGGGRITGFHGGSALVTFFTMLPVFCRYLGMIIWPASLSAEYNPPIHQFPDTVVLAAFFLLLAVCWCGWWLYRLDRRLGFWVPFFVVALIPVSQIVPLFTLMNDRYLYFPMLSVAALGGTVASALVRAWDNHPKLACLLIVIPLMLLSGVTYKRAGVWRDPVALWSDAVAKVPNSARSWDNLGAAYLMVSNIGSALYCLNRGHDLDPNNADTLYDIGITYMIAGDNDQAHRFLNKLLRVAPNHITGLVAFGDTCVKQGNYADAEKNYLHSHHLQPGAIEPLIKLGKLAVITHHLDDAREYFLKAEKISVDNPDIAYNIASVESMSGRLDSAFTWLDKALRLGYVDLHALRTNHELMVVRADRRFEALVSRYFGDSH